MLLSHYQYCKSKGLSSSIIFEFILITRTVELCGAAKQTQVLQLQLHISVELPPSVLDIVRPGLGTHSHFSFTFGTLHLQTIDRIKIVSA